MMQFRKALQKLKFIIDVDDVLCKCNEYALAKLNEEYGTSYNLYDITSWGMTGTLLDERLKYYSDPEFFKSIPLIEGAQEFIKNLLKRGEVYICTNVQPQCAGTRVQYIIDNFPEIDPGNIIIGGRKDLLKGDFMLDDCLANIKSANVDFPVMLSRPWNMDGSSGIVAVTGYDEFLELVDIILAAKMAENPEYELVTLVGPSGSGKTEIAEKLLQTGAYERVMCYSTKKRGESFKYCNPVEFANMRDAKEFCETSVYMGDWYGVRKSDIDTVIKRGKKPLLVLDINGAVSLRKFYQTLNVFVKSDRESCIRNILNKNLEVEDSVKRISAIEAEMRNEILCDISVEDSIEEIERRVA